MVFGLVSFSVFHRSESGKRHMQAYICVKRNGLNLRHSLGDIFLNSLKSTLN